MPLILISRSNPKPDSTFHVRCTSNLLPWSSCACSSLLSSCASDKEGNIPPPPLSPIISALPLNLIPIFMFQLIPSVSCFRLTLSCLLSVQFGLWLKIYPEIMGCCIFSFLHCSSVTNMVLTCVPDKSDDSNDN